MILKTIQQILIIKKEIEMCDFIEDVKVTDVGEWQLVYDRTC
jgi:hypothetical protein